MRWLRRLRGGYTYKKSIIRKNNTRKNNTRKNSITKISSLSAKNSKIMRSTGRGKGKKTRHCNNRKKK